MLTQLQNISKSFSGNLVLSNVDLTVKPGQIHALVGENGAGKSTLMKILTGIEQPDAGKILVDNQQKRWHSPINARRAGIAMVHQELALVPELTVTENIFLGRLLKQYYFGVDWSLMLTRTRQTFNQLEFDINPQQRVGQLSTAKKQMVEIARALTHDAQLIILDEPTSSLASREVKQLFKSLKSIAATGVSIIYITHRLDEVFALTEQVSVLRDGKLISSHPVADIDAVRIVRDMVGRELTEQFPSQKKRATLSVSRIALEVRNATRHGVFQDISFQLQSGEILGLAGLVGSGRTELLEAVFGINKLDAGEILINGSKTKINSPRAAYGSGLGLIPDDRKNKGLVLEAGAGFNLNLSTQNKFTSGFGWRDKTQEQQAAQALVDDLNIKLVCLKQAVGRLSGGNQQKVVIGRTLNSDASVLLIDEPTRGVDVGAKREIYFLLRSLADSGKAILLVSSELEEIIGLCDRVLVMHQGTIQGILPATEATQEQIMRLAVGLNR